MSGESQRDVDPDFLDDDFILEDVAPKNDGLDQLFEMPESVKPKPAAGSVASDSDDVLFTDHTDGLAPTEKFESGPPFSETERSNWSSEGLDLDAVGVPPAESEVTEDDAEALAGAEASFTAELDSLLQSGDDFGLDSDKELEVVNAGDGISEFEQSGPFVLDDGEGTWQDEAASQEDPNLGVPVEPTLSTDADEQAEPGWEPLERTTVDELSEVEEVARADDDSMVAADGEPAFAEDDGYTEDGAAEPEAPSWRPALVGADAPAEGHDLYVNEESAEVIGARAPRGRGGRMLFALAASLTIVAAGAVVVLRPEWIGLRLAPERLQQAQVSRPEVAVAVPIPAPPSEPVATTPPDGVEPNGSNPILPVPPDAIPTLPAPTEPPALPEPPVPTPPAAGATTVAGSPTSTSPENPLPVATTDPVAPPPVPVATTTPPPDASPVPVAQITPAEQAPRWPVPIAPDVAGASTTGSPANQPTRLLRLSEELLMGDHEEPNPVAKTVDGVMPGARAFAQLNNGNYFIGSVKSVDAERLTLRVDTGEVTIQVAAIARLTELGSADYDDLQRVTSGFVRLTNNNRLVGGILSHIADDHVVLEFRSNRVMLPRSAIGEVVQGEDDASVRLDTTREEDDWLRRLVERELGTGTGVVPPTKSAAAPTGGSNSPR